MKECRGGGVRLTLAGGRGASDDRKRAMPVDTGVLRSDCGY